MWTQTHADWWTDHHGNSIHRVQVADDDDAPAERFYCHRVGDRLPWSGEAETLGEAQAQIEQH